MHYGVSAVGQQCPCPCCKPVAIGKLAEAGAAKKTRLLVNVAQLMLNSCLLADKLQPFDFSGLLGTGLHISRSRGAQVVSNPISMLH